MAFCGWLPNISGSQDLGLIPNPKFAQRMLPLETEEGTTAYTKYAYRILPEIST